MICICTIHWDRFPYGIDVMEADWPTTAHDKYKALIPSNKTEQFLFYGKSVFFRNNLNTSSLSTKRKISLRHVINSKNSIDDIIKQPQLYQIRFALIGSYIDNKDEIKKHVEYIVNWKFSAIMKDINEQLNHLARSKK